MLQTSPRPDAVRRIIVLTDGHANEGLTNPDALAGMVGGGRTNGVTTSVIGFGDGYDEVLQEPWRIRVAAMTTGAGPDDVFTSV